MAQKNKTGGYKIHDLAKDLNKSSNDIISLLGNYSEGEKKSQTTLTPDELDIVFEALTQSNMAASFDEYIALTKNVSSVKKPEPEAPAEPKKTAKDKAEKPEKAEKAPAKDAAKAKPEGQKKAAPADKKRGEQKPAAQKTDAQSKPDGETKAPASKPFEKRAHKKNDGPMQARTKGDMRTIDTRSTNVDLDKYNEKYEDIAPEKSRMKDRDTAKKQKINQKSKQYRKQGTHSGKKETEQERLARIAAERAKKQIVIKVGDEITVGELASRLKLTASEVIKKLFMYGIMASINETIDFDTAEIVATDLGAKVEKEVVVTIEYKIIDDSEDDEASLLPRSPVVCVMGHVDHGKTSLLDAIRNTSVTATESGGITQHIGAYRVNVDGNDITFLDTPGHAAFTSMRARGAMATDIAILVVAADDGIMPQTIEAINHAKAAGINIIVAINKMDKPDVNPDRILQQLTEHEIVPEEWGGDTICVPVSAKTHMNIDKLLESVLLVAEMKELKANPNRSAKGIVIEARLDKGRGPIATLLVQNGTLRNGDTIVAGTAVGRVRVMTDYKGQKVSEAGPSVPVEIAGLTEAPNAGDAFDAVSDERLARELVEQRKQKEKEAQFSSVQKVTLDNLFSTIEAGEMKELNIIVKADVQGSVEAVKQSLEKLSNNEVRVKVIHGGVGAVNESDVMLAHASNAIIIGFHVRPDPVAAANAERDHVEMRMYMVIYDCIEDVEAAIKGMLAPKIRDVDLGRLEVRSTFKISSVGTIAGCYILSGKIQRNAKIRVVRDGIVIAEDEIDSLRRFKDDVKEVATGYECGVGLKKFNDIKDGDIFEAYITEEYRDQ